MGNGTDLPPTKTDDSAADTVGGNGACVVIPTTGGLVWVLGLKDRVRLKSSYAVLENDFRHLKLSRDYHQFVSGPLTAVRAPEPVCELSLSAHIDTGRSWEFPTLIAHLLQSHDRLCFPDQSKLERDGEPGCDLIWATGMLDPELAPVAADYKLARKLELSRPLFEACRKAGRKVDILLSSDLPADERRLFADMADKLQMDYHEVADLEDVQKRLDQLPGASGDGQPWAAASEVRLAPPFLQKLALPSDWQRPAMISVIVVGLLAAFWALSGLFSSDPSITPGVSPSNKMQQSAAVPVSLEQLSARDRNACRESVMSAGRLGAHPLQQTGKAQFQVTPTGYLCGLRFRNDGKVPLELKLDTAMESYSIRGNGALFRGRSLRPGKSVELYLSRPPGELQVELSVTQKDNARHTLAIRFLRQAAGN